jgi:glutaryl-CoA dehydrogenase
MGAIDLVGSQEQKARWLPPMANVPLENSLAHASTFEDANRVFNQTRGGAAWECVGHAVACLEAAVAYAKERSQFGQPIAGFQLVQGRLATMVAETAAMQLICFRPRSFSRTAP